MTLIQKTILAGALAFGLLLFAATNAVWTSVDGKPRFGSSLILDSGIGEALASLPNTFRKDQSEYLLPDLPEIAGWTRTDIVDPWTARPVNLDGSIPDDAQMDEIIAARHFGPGAPDWKDFSFQTVKDRRDRADGAKRTGANYTDGTVRFNVLVERLGSDDPVNPDIFGPIGYLLYQGGGVLSLAFDLLRDQRVIAGVPFTRTRTRGHEHSTQQDSREATINLETEHDGYALRIWGDGTEEDVERLLMAFRAIVQPHPLGTGDLD